MSRVIFQDTYIIILPSFPKAEQHRHPMLHLFCGNDGCNIVVKGEKYSEQVIVLDTNVSHSARMGNNCELFLLIDPTSDIAGQMHEKYLNKGTVAKGFSMKRGLPENLWQQEDDDIVRLVEKLFEEIGIEKKENCQKEQRIEEVIQHLKSGEWLNDKIARIAERVCLSESRLTHLFTEEIGVSLKSYILIRKLEYAYQYTMSGGKITNAAYEAGFSSSAHLAYTCKKMMGVSISEVLKKKK